MSFTRALLTKIFFDSSGPVRTEDGQFELVCVFDTGWPCLLDRQANSLHKTRAASDGILYGFLTGRKSVVCEKSHAKLSQFQRFEQRYGRGSEVRAIRLGEQFHG